MKNLLTPALLLILPQLAFACTFGLTQVVPLLPLFVQLVFVILISKKLFDHFMRKRSIVTLSKYLVPLLASYAAYSFVTTFLIRAMCNSYGRDLYLESIKLCGFFLSVTGLLIFFSLFVTKNRKYEEKFVLTIAIATLFFIFVQIAVAGILPSSMFPQEQFYV